MDDKSGTEPKYNIDNETLSEFYAKNLPEFDAGLEVGGATHIKNYENNKSRIPLILDLIEHYWIEEPNLPFGRLLAKIHHNYNNDYVYRVSDEDFLGNLELYGEMNE